jgi:alpha-tubulin suppressor-like RCC1 family protein
LTSGGHHSLALTADGTIYGFGDAECGKIGMIAEKDTNRSDEPMKLDNVGAKNAVDIFASKH